MEGWSGGETIVVRGRKSEDRGYDDKKRRRYSFVEFHKVDLKGGKVEKNCYPKLKIWNHLGRMVQAGRKLYIIGGLCEDEDVESASVLDLDNKGCSWKQLPLPSPVKDLIIPRCASLDEKIYHYEFHNPNPLKEVEEEEDPSLGFLEIMRTPRDVQYRSSGAVIADPDNKRIIVYMFDDGELYAYYPLERTMKPVGSRVFLWSSVVALADNVAYVHESDSTKLLHAFDLSQGGKALDVAWTSTVVETKINGVYRRVDLMRFGFHALFHVGSGYFWFAAWYPVNLDHENVRLYLIMFKVRHSKSNDKIFCTPLALRIPQIDSTCCIFDFVLLH